MGEPADATRALEVRFWLSFRATFPRNFAGQLDHAADLVVVQVVQDLEQQVVQQVVVNLTSTIDGCQVSLAVFLLLVLGTDKVVAGIDDPPWPPAAASCCAPAFQVGNRPATGVNVNALTDSHPIHKNSQATTAGARQGRFPGRGAHLTIRVIRGWPQALQGVVSEFGKNRTPRVRSVRLRP